MYFRVLRTCFYQCVAILWTCGVGNSSCTRVLHLIYCIFQICVIFSSVADPRSGIRCFFYPWIRDRFFPDLGSRIPTSYFWELGDNFLSKKLYNSLKIGPNSFLQHFKNKIISIMVSQQIFSPLSFVAAFGSGIRGKHPGSATRFSVNSFGFVWPYTCTGTGHTYCIVNKSYL